MLTPEQFAEKQRIELVQFNRKQEIASDFLSKNLPIPEYISDGKLYGNHSVTYRNNIHHPNGFDKALELFEKFHSIPFKVFRGSYCVICPIQNLPKDYSDFKQTESEFIAMIKVHHIHNSQPRATLRFFIDKYNVEIEFGTDYIGGCSKLGPKVITTSNSRKYVANPKLQSMCNHMVSYAGTYESTNFQVSSDHVYCFRSIEELKQVLTLGA